MDFGKPAHSDMSAGAGRLRRRQVIKHLSTLPFLGVVVFAAFRKSQLKSMEEQHLADASSGATGHYIQNIKTGNSDELSNLNGRVFTEETEKLTGKLPVAKLGHLDVSRAIMGGNLISGYAHSRDLIYVSSLVRNYNKKKGYFAR